MLIIYAADYLMHGAFGVEIAQWREPNALRNSDDLAANLAIIAKFARLVFLSTGFGDVRLAIMNAFLIAAALTVVARRERLLALNVAAGIYVGVGLLCLHILLKGALVPFRSTIFVCAFFVASDARAAFLNCASLPRKAAVGQITLPSLTGFFALQVRAHYAELGQWQIATRQLAQSTPSGTETFYVYGSYTELPGAEDTGIQHFRDLCVRLICLTGAQTILCDEAPGAWLSGTPPFDLKPALRTTLIESEGSVAHVPLRAPETGF